MPKKATYLKAPKAVSNDRVDLKRPVIALISSSNRVGPPPRLAEMGKAERALR